jgi:hypothetical protein
MTPAGDFKGGLDPARALAEVMRRVEAGLASGKSRHAVFVDASRYLYSVGDPLKSDQDPHGCLPVIKRLWGTPAAAPSWGAAWAAWASRHDPQPVSRADLRRRQCVRKRAAELLALARRLKRMVRREVRRVLAEDGPDLIDYELRRKGVGRG